MDNNTNQEKIVVLRDECNEDDGIALSTIFGVMFHNFIRLIIITLIIGLLGIIIIRFVYNPSKTTYLCQFNFSIPSYNNNTLIDGTNFTPSDLVTEKVLTYAKNSDSSFSNIDINTLMNNKGLAITTIEEKSDDDEETKPISYYQISVKTNAFSNDTQAKKFLVALVNYPLAYNLDAQKTLNYKTNFVNYNSASTYESQISYLQSQLSFLNDKYNSIISNYGDITFTSEKYSGKKVSVILNEINNYFATYSFANLSLEVSEEGYVFGPSEKVQLQYERDDLDRKIKYNDTKIKDLQDQLDKLISTNPNAQSYDINSYNTAISTLTQEKVDYQTRIDSIDRKLNHVGETPDSFKNILKDYYDYLYSATEDYQNYNEYEAIDSYSKINYVNSSIIKTNGGLSTVITYVAPIAIGLVCGLVVNLICDRKYLKEPFPPRKKLIK